MFNKKFLLGFFILALGFLFIKFDEQNTRDSNVQLPQFSKRKNKRLNEDDFKRYIEAENEKLTAFKKVCGDNVNCYHDKIVKTLNFALCPSVRNYWDDENYIIESSCLMNIAIKINKSSICSYILNEEIKNSAFRL